MNADYRPGETEETELDGEARVARTTQQAQVVETAQTAQVTQPVPIVLENEEELVVPLAEEYLDVDKQWVKSGEVIVHKSLHTETQTLPIEIGYEEVQIDRVPVNRPLKEGESVEPKWEGDVMVLPVIEEEIVVTKRQVVREELRIYRRRMVRQESVSGTVRKEQIDIETTGSLQPKDEDVPGVTNR